jgi:uncharacterized protein (UPF0147 family)
MDYMDNDDIQLWDLLEDTANMLRGMTVDPAIPNHAKEAMWNRISTIAAMLETRPEDVDHG